MFSQRLRATLQTATACLTLCAVTLGQTPAPTPPTPQQDATRPPGTQQTQPIPEQARPPANPTQPPGTF